MIYAPSYQRRRRVWTLINGGPGSALHKSTDAGATWTKLGGGLPGGELGRIGMAISPADPDVLYAVIDKSCSGIDGEMNNFQGVVVRPADGKEVRIPCAEEAKGRGFGSVKDRLKAVGYL